MTRLILLVCAVGFSGCTDGARAKYGAMGNTAEIVCYSGGVEIMRTKSTGMVGSEEKSDGWFFNDAKTNRLVRTNADCIIRSDP
jgi:hypothetical protein